VAHADNPAEARERPGDEALDIDLHCGVYRDLINAATNNANIVRVRIGTAIALNCARPFS